MCYYNKKNPSPIVAAKRKELNPRKKIDDFIDEKIDECPLHKQTIFDFSSAQSEHTSHSYKQLYKHWTIRNVDNAKVTYRIELSFSDNHENIHTLLNLGIGEIPQQNARSKNFTAIGPCELQSTNM